MAGVRASDPERSPGLRVRTLPGLLAGRVRRLAARVLLHHSARRNQARLRSVSSDSTRRARAAQVAAGVDAPSLPAVLVPERSGADDPRRLSALASHAHA